jgi:L-rhamnose mutarotase
MDKTEVNQRWASQMPKFFLADDPPDQSFTRIAEVFHLD